MKEETYFQLSTLNSPLIKPGYKQTEVGVIPEDWEVAALGDLGDFSKGSGVRKNEAQSGDLPCVRYGEIYTYHNDIVRKYNSRISPEVAKTAKRLRKGDVLFAGSGETKEEIGKAVAFVADDETYAGGDIVILSPRTGSSEFLGYALNAPPVIRQKASKGQGDAVVHISANAIASIKLALPTKEEQTAIAQALSDVDTLLATLDQLIAKKRDLKQAAMQQLLTGKTRLPGFEGEWEVKRLGDVADIRSGGTPSTGDSAAWDGAIPWCTPTDITALGGRKYLTTTSRTITDHGLKNSSAELIPAHSIVMTSRATIGECAINSVPMTTNQGFKNLISLSSIDVEFLYYLLLTQTQGLIGLSAGSTFLEISKTQLKQYEVRLPTMKEEQTAIATVLSDMGAEIAVLEARRNKTQHIKQAMMQELLTGKTRLV